MTTTATTQTATRASATPHAFVTPVVRELPRPTEPASFASCW